MAKGTLLLQGPWLTFSGVQWGVLYPSQFSSAVDVIVGVSVGGAGVFVGAGVYVAVAGCVFVGVGGGAA